MLSIIVQDQRLISMNRLGVQRIHHTLWTLLYPLPELRYRSLLRSIGSSILPD
jgi:hypothetical protein